MLPVYRTWTYEQDAAGPPGHQVLRGVQPPHGGSWRYDYASGLPGELTKVTWPTRGQTTYTYVDGIRRAAALSMTTRVVATRVVGGHDTTPGTWTFSYGAGPNQDTTIATCPCGTTTYRFLGTGLAGDFSAWSAGALAEQTVEQQGTVLERQTFTWQPSVAISPDPVPGTDGVWSDPAVHRPLLVQHTTTRGTQSWTTTLEYHPTQFNTFGQPWRITETGEFTRTATRTFYSNFTIHLAPQGVSESVTVGTETVVRGWDYDGFTGFVRWHSGPGVSVRLGPTPHGNVNAVLDDRDNLTSFNYVWGQRERVTTPNTEILTLINQDGTIHSEHRGTLITTYHYDRGSLVSVQPPGGTNPITYDYEPFWRQWVRTSRGGRSTTVTQDGFGRVRSTEESTGVKTRTERDACGRIIFESVPYSGVWTTLGVSTEYDALGRVTRRTDPEQKVTTFVYEGLDVRRFDAAGRQTFFDFSAAGSPAGARLISVRDAATVTTAYTHHVTDQLASATVPGTALQRTWGYNARGQLTSDTQPERGTTTYLYDAAGNLTHTTDALNQTVIRSYDSDNRLTFVDHPGTVDDLTITYDALGRMAMEAIPGHGTTYSYDASGRLQMRSEQVGGLTWSSTYAYDANDNLTSITYPSGRVVTYIYNSQQRLVEVRQNGQAFAHSFTYDGAGRLASYQTGAVTHTVTYTDAQRVRRMTSAGLLDLTYGYDAVGNVATITDPRPGASQAFLVDVLDRVTKADGPWGGVSWAYDAAGNRLSETAGGVTTYSYQPSTQRLLSTSGTMAETFTYDALGRLTSDGRGTYGYRPRGLLGSVTAADVSASYVYDPAGLRLSRTLNGQTTYAVRSAGGEVLSEYTAACAGTPAWTRDTIYTAGRPLGAVSAEIQTPTVSFSQADVSVGEAAGSVTLTVVLGVPGGGALGCAVTAAVQTSDGTAQAGADYTPRETTVTFAAGSVHGATRTVIVSVLNDALHELDETFHADLVQVTGGSAGPVARTTITIVDDDLLPALSIANTSVTEGPLGSTTNATFTVTLSGGSGQAVQVAWATTNGTALAGRDYTLSGGTLTIPAGQVSGPLTVPVIGDRLCEPHETFLVTLSQPVHATIAHGQATGTILDDDTNCRTWGDFYAPRDGAADAALFNPVSRLWRFRDSNGGVATGSYGPWGDTLIYGDIFVPGDYDGDGTTDFAVYRPNGVWYIAPASGVPWYTRYWVAAQAGDIPAPADYDGDGKIDPAFYRPSDGFWRIYPSGTMVPYVVNWGIPGGTVHPVPADYDGDGKADVAFYQPDTGVWYIVLSQTGQGHYINWGIAGSPYVTAAPADYDGDGKADVAFYSASDLFWYLVPSTTNTATYIYFGTATTDIAVPADYDGDGKADVAIYVFGTRTFHIRRSTTGYGELIPMADVSEAGAMPVLRRPR